MSDDSSPPRPFNHSFHSDRQDLPVSDIVKDISKTYQTLWLLRHCEGNTPDLSDIEHPLRRNTQDMSDVVDETKTHSTYRPEVDGKGVVISIMQLFRVEQSGQPSLPQNYSG